MPLNDRGISDYAMLNMFTSIDHICEYILQLLKFQS